MFHHTFSWTEMTFCGSKEHDKRSFSSPSFKVLIMMCTESVTKVDLEEETHVLPTEVELMTAASDYGRELGH